MNKRTLTYLGCGLAVVLFFAVNIVANSTMRSWRVDLTEDQVYTLDQNSKTIAKGIAEPINLYFYFSSKLARGIPQVIEYKDRVLGILREYERASDGGIRLSVVDPEPFSEEEDRAVEQGVQGVPLPNGDSLYFGLVGTSATDAREVIPFFALEEAKQRTLEYDLSKLVWTLANPHKKKVAILSALPLEGGGGNPMMGQQGPPRWAILDQIEDFFETEVLPASTTEVPADVGILMVVHPRGFGEATQYLIDQWALAGKPLLVFVDPHCDADPGESADPSNPMSRYMAAKDSNLESLFSAWGIELVKSKVACDRDLGFQQRVPSRDRRSQAVLPLVFVPRLGEQNLDRNDPVTRQLGSSLGLLLMTPGSLRKKAEGTTTFAPLLQTSESSQEVDSTAFQFQPDPEQLLANFVPGYEKLTLAARVTGNVKTAFPGGKPGAGEPAPAADGAPADAPKPAGLAESAQPLNLIVFADADLLSDGLWMQSMGTLPGGQALVAMTSENPDLVKNAIESVAGGKELMGIRTRGKTSRPFEKVLDIKRVSEQRFLLEQQELERKLQDAETRLRELQKATSGNSEELVTAQQREEENKVREEFVQTRRDLRDVRHKLLQDIERLGTRLKWLNIALMPVLVSAAAVALGAWRTKQRNQGL